MCTSRLLAEEAERGAEEASLRLKKREMELRDSEDREARLDERVKELSRASLVRF